MRAVYTGLDGAVEVQLIQGTYSLRAYHDGDLSDLISITVVAGATLNVVLYLQDWRSDARSTNLNIVGVPRSTRLDIGQGGNSDTNSGLNISGAPGIGLLILGM